MILSALFRIFSESYFSSSGNFGLSVSLISISNFLSKGRFSSFMKSSLSSFRVDLILISFSFLFAISALAEASSFSAIDPTLIFSFKSLKYL